MLHIKYFLKRAPMSEIAFKGNISKALLFHYFTNKKAIPTPLRQARISYPKK